MTLILRYMTLNDIHQVASIDHAAFSTPWSFRTYAYEITEAETSHMVVLEADSARSRPYWRRLWHRLRKSKAAASKIVAYGGLRIIMQDQAHIITIASHPDERKKGYGEIVLAAMIQRAINLNAQYVVLEVRVSNRTAQNLYRKYGFDRVAIKQHYYRDDGEDAYEMRLRFTCEVCENLKQRWAVLQQQMRFEDQYTHLLHAS